ncbi:hypothetical protein, partial [Klebsiella pneumoniae]|uniref:hypothetical protein n=1 Tax=Klebsiella pneumoniae TaxID=573 RepID=UPI001954C35F
RVGDEGDVHCDRDGRAKDIYQFDRCDVRRKKIVVPVAMPGYRVSRGPRARADAPGPNAFNDPLRPCVDATTGQP